MQLQKVLRFLGPRRHGNHGRRAVYGDVGGVVRLPHNELGSNRVLPAL